MQKYSIYDNYNPNDSEHASRPPSDLDSTSTSCPDQEANFDSISIPTMAPSRAVFYKSGDVLAFNDLRRYSRLSDKDLKFHAGRIYLDGTNSPLSWLGGAWHWPMVCPSSLQFSIIPEQYASFAQKVNFLMQYPRNGWEMRIYLVLLILLPPYAEYFLLKRRLFRSKLLLSTLSTTENPFFKSPQCSLRLSVSPDLTVAYVDFLVDVDTHHRAVVASQAMASANTISPLPGSSGGGSHETGRPVVKRTSSRKSMGGSDISMPGPLGQPKLPIFIRFCGMGTYFSPWYLDTNDLLLQAIPLSNDVSVFIDKAFIKFVYDLNKILKSVRRYRLKEDLVVLLKV